MAKGNSGFFTPKNTYKLIKKIYPLKYKSSWELYFMNFLDKNPNILKWGYEIINIPYYNPFKKKMSIYVPDFFIKYVDANNNVIHEIVEIKPSTEFLIESARTRNQKLNVVLNSFKWTEAKKWCEKRNINFRVISEKEIFI